MDSHELNVTVIITDPSPFFDQGISDCLRTAGYAVAGQAGSLDETRRLVCQHQSNVLLIGPILAPEDSLAICRAARCLQPGIRILVINTQAGDSQFQNDATQAGAEACLPVEISCQDLLQILDTDNSLPAENRPPASQPASQPTQLTGQELKVLRLLAEGKTDEEIAASLFISRNTVRKHCQRILKKREVHSREKAIQRARQQGLL